MAFLKPNGGNGLQYGSYTLMDTQFYVGVPDITQDFNAILQFFSQSNFFVGDIRLDHDNSNFLQLKMNQDKIGGLKSFEFDIDKLPDYSFFNLMKVKIFINNLHWYTGELLLSTEPDERNPVKTFKGRGYVKYLDDIDNITVTYENKTLREIIIDVLDNYILADTPLEKNEDFINPPDITVTKLEINKKSARKILDDVLEIANKDYDTDQYTMGADKDLFYYFGEISREVKNNYFEGFQFQEPKVKTDDSKIINEMDIFRATEGAGNELELITTIQDAESQARYGLRKSKVTINDFISTTAGINIANAKLNKFKLPFTELSIEDLEVDEPLEVGFYNISNRVQEYNKLVNDCEDINEWDLSTSTSTITIDNTDYISGKNSIKIDSSGSAAGDSMILELNESIMYPTTLRMYIKQNKAGNFIDLTAFDEDGNEITAGFTRTFKILLEDGGAILLESGGSIIGEEVERLGITVQIIEDWYRFEFDISTIDNLKKIKIFVSSDEEFISNIDRIEVMSKSYFTRKLTTEKIKYILNRTSVKANVMFGEKISNIIDDVKSLESDDKLLLGLFQK